MKGKRRAFITAQMIGTGRILRFTIRFYDSRFYGPRAILGRIVILTTLVTRARCVGALDPIIED
ncbi:hypothetical protein CRG98_048031 [Punica granatum]|uniref:Uncharacterized protein n=1 Tax=Punica granatum TaxID=22663 RepID=A0A2I0HIR1_PUNGR|nr:hypothetical protein CRG98_048031 [Punica granatum]